MNPDAIYVSTHLGHRFYPQAPRIEDVAIKMLGLAFQCRFNGQTQRFYSVAQHSLMVAELVPRVWPWPPCCTMRPRLIWATWSSH